jgi:hypothetical protein
LKYAVDALADAVAALPPVLRVAHSLPPATAPLASAAETVAATPLRFAVIAVGGTQFKVTVNDLITPAKVPFEVGKTMEFTPLMVSR